MELVGNISRMPAIGAFARPPAAGPVAPTVRSGNDGARSSRDGHQSTSEKHDKVVQAGHALAAKPKAKVDVEEPREQPEPVTIDPIFDRRVGNSRSGIYVDLVYRNTNFRAVRLFGPSSNRDEQATGVADGTVSANDAARAYRAARSDADQPASTVLTG